MSSLLRTPATMLSATGLRGLVGASYRMPASERGHGAFGLELGCAEDSFATIQAGWNPQSQAKRQVRGKVKVEF